MTRRLLDNLEDIIADALGTAERDDALVEVASKAHRAEVKLAAIQRLIDERTEIDGYIHDSFELLVEIREKIDQP